MSVAYFEEQRREMIAAIKVIAEHLVAEIWQDGAGRSGPQSDGQSAAARVRADRGPAIRLPEQATADRLR